MDVAPPRTLGVFIGGILLAAGLGGIALGVAGLSRLSFSAGLVVWVALPVLGAVLAALAGYRLYGLLTARYVLNRNGIGVRWGLAVEEIPLSLLRLERLAANLGRDPRPRGSLSWPGCLIGTTEVEGIGQVEFFATRPAERLLVVRSPERTLLISPPDREAFLRAFAEAARQGVLDPIEPRSVRPDLFPERLWRDPWARALLLIGTTLPLLLLGYLGVRAGSLPEAVPFGFDPLGVPEAVGSPGRLLLLPLIGGLCWAVDFALGSAFYRREQDRPLAYAVWAAAVVVDVLLWGAALSLLAGL
jgi:hypothetical protein